jgi:CRISPR-associated protein Cas1
MLSAWVYCPRQFYLQWVLAEKGDTAALELGRREHAEVDQPQGILPSPAEITHSSDFEATSISLSSERLGLTTRFDTLRCRGGKVIPVEQKHGKPPPRGLWPSDQAQVLAQALILRNEGYQVEEAIVAYQAGENERKISLNETVLNEFQKLLASVRETELADMPPEPLEQRKHCPKCSMVGLCLPEEQTDLSSMMVDGESPNRFFPARPDSSPFYVQAQGAYIGKKGDGLEVREKNGEKTQIRFLDISQLSIFGNATLSQPALTSLLGRNIPICHFSYGGWFYGMTAPISRANALVRQHQYQACLSDEFALKVARELVSRKIWNSRSFYRRNAEGASVEILESLKTASQQALTSTSLEQLRGIEGSASKKYFSGLNDILKRHGEFFAFHGRNRRPPRDPMNALLSLAYSVLAKDWTIALASAGLDPFLGFYHQSRFGRPSLALDLMEEFRPIIADSVAFLLINNNVLNPNDFLARGGGVTLLPDARKKFFQSYERRMAQLFKHPVFGYQISMRRALEVQARLFSRYLSDELPEYAGVRLE